MFAMLPLRSGLEATPLRWLARQSRDLNQIAVISTAKLSKFCHKQRAKRVLL
jgi:hypothetical protein